MSNITAPGEPAIKGASAPTAAAALVPRDRTDVLLDAILRVIRLGPVLVLVLMFVVFGLINPLFLSFGNLSDLLIQSTPILLIGLGQLMVIISQGIDLSVGAVAGFASISGWFIWNAFHLPGWLVVLVIIAIGAGWGLVNGLVLVKFKIANPFIVTLGALYAVGGLALMISKGEPKSGQADLVIFLGSGRIPLPFGIFLPMPVVVAVVVAALVGIFISSTRWGRWIFAIGGNPEGAVRAGIPVGAVRISVYVISGGLAGIAAVVLSGRVGGGDANLGNGYELLTIAAVVIGGGSFFGGRGSIWNVVVGALVVIGIRNGLNLSDVDSNLLTVVVGAVLVLAVGLDGGRASVESAVRKRRARRAEGL
jgi:ribose transport system permease protein